jgi:hypothetical protein
MACGSTALMHLVPSAAVTVGAPLRSAKSVGGHRLRNVARYSGVQREGVPIALPGPGLRGVDRGDDVLVKADESFVTSAGFAGV